MEQTYRFSFTGTGLAYFKIWAVNMLLSIITLGIYSPWAKVRNNAYLYSNTELNGDSFEYTAKPIRILIGRLIVFALYFVYFLLQDVLGFYLFATIFAVIALSLVPWLMRQAVSFRMRYTRYRGVSFSYHASTRQYYKFFLMHILLNAITLFLAFPYTLKKLKDLIVNNTYYGDKNFDFKGSVADFYILHLKYYATFFAMLLVFIFAGAFFLQTYNFELSSIKGIDAQDVNAIKNILIIGVLTYFVFLFILITTKGMWDAWMAKIVYPNTSLANFKLSSEQKALSLGWIYASNFLLVLVSFGLLHPYCKVRALKYKLSHISTSGDGFDEFTNKTLEDTKALGEESMDFFDIDVGI